MTPDELPHRGDCTDPTAVRTMGGRGDPMMRCTTCRAFRLLSGDTEPDELEPSPTPRPAPRHRAVIPCASCGVHLPHTTTRAAVRYCGPCKSERRTAEARRAARKAARREAEVTPWGWLT